MKLRKVGEQQAFDLTAAVKHLDGGDFPFHDFYNEVAKIRREAKSQIPPEIDTDDLYNWMMCAGWITFPDDKTWGDHETISFKIVEDVREVRKRIEKYKKDFIKDRAQAFLSQEEEDGQFYPCDVNTSEYRTAVQELAKES